MRSEDLQQATEVSDGDHARHIRNVGTFDRSRKWRAQPFTIGNKLGSVEDIMIDRIGGIYAVLSFGGFLGMGATEYPLPWER